MKINEKGTKQIEFNNREADFPFTKTRFDVKNQQIPLFVSPLGRFVQQLRCYNTMIAEVIRGCYKISHYLVVTIIAWSRRNRLNNVE